MESLLSTLAIPPDRLDALNAVFLDPDLPVMKDLLAVIAKYGTPEEINACHRQSRKFENLLAMAAAKNRQHAADLEWLIRQRDNRVFISLADYQARVRGTSGSAGGAAAAVGPNAAAADKNPVTLEVSALQYFPWIRPMCERAIAESSLIPGRFIAVRKMKESEADGDLPAIIAAMDIMGCSFVETLDTKGTDGSNPHLGGPATITGYFGGIGQPNAHALAWIDEFLYYYTNYGLQSVLNFNAGTILLAFLLYRLGVDINFKISVFFGSDNPYHALWIMTAAKLFSRPDGTSPLVGFNWSNSVNNATIQTAAAARRALGFEHVIRFEHHITETWKSIVLQPYNRRAELLDLAATVPNIAAKHEGGDPDIEQTRAHPSDILDYFRDKAEIISSGDWDALQLNFMDKVSSCNATARALTARGLGILPAPRLH